LENKEEDRDPVKGRGEKKGKKKRRDCGGEDLSTPTRGAYNPTGKKEMRTRKKARDNQKKEKKDRKRSAAINLNRPEKSEGKSRRGGPSATCKGDVEWGRVEERRVIRVSTTLGGHWMSL